MDTVAQACERSRDLVETCAPLEDALACLVRAAEHVAGPCAVGSVLVLDADGLLRNGASPGLPRHYIDAIDGLRPDPRVGTCAAAAATGEPVLTPNFVAAAGWTELRHLPLELGLVGAWSHPIKSPRDGRVLGTFGTYDRDVRQPTPQEREAVQMLARAAAHAIEADAAREGVRVPAGGG